MDWLGAALGIAGDLFGQSSALDAQNAMMEKQMQFNREVMQNRHQWEVNDLKQAGLNPLMSVTSPTGTLSAPTPASVPKMNLAQSAAAMSQISLNQKMGEAAVTNADAAKINADANMIKAQNDSKMTDFHLGPEFEMRTGLNNAQIKSAIASAGLADSQTALNRLQEDWLPKLYKANLDEIENRIATAWFIAYAQDYNLRTTADAATANAAANMVHANAAMYGAEAQHRFAAVAEDLGISQKELMKANKDKIGEEINNILTDVERKRRYNRYESEYEDDWLYRESRYEGQVVGNMADFFTGAGRFIK